jgi:hypothetical protein
VLKPYGNVVVEWSETPTDEQTETLEGCVSQPGFSSLGRGQESRVMTAQ